MNVETKMKLSIRHEYRIPYPGNRRDLSDVIELADADRKRLKMPHGFDDDLRIEGDEEGAVAYWECTLPAYGTAEGLDLLMASSAALDVIAERLMATHHGVWGNHSETTKESYRDKARELLLSAVQAANS